MGTKFSVKDPNPGAWFSFDEKDQKSGRICLRITNQAAADAIDKKVAKKRVEYKQGSRFEVRDFDQDAYFRELWDYCIVGWDGLEDDDGNVIECTPANKVKLMSENIGFSSFVGSCIKKLNDDIEAERERVRKNLLSTSSD